MVRRPDKETLSRGELINSICFYIMLCIRTPELTIISNTAVINQRTDCSHTMYEVGPLLINNHRKISGKSPEISLRLSDDNSRNTLRAASGGLSDDDKTGKKVLGGVVQSVYSCFSSAGAAGAKISSKVFAP